MRLSLLVVTILICSLLPRTAAAAEESASAEIIALEIRNLSTSVDRLTRLLYDQGQQKQQDAMLRKLDIAVAYLNFRSRRIEALERDLQNSRSMKTRLEDFIQQVDNRLEQIEENSRNDSTTDESTDQVRNETLEQRKMLKQRLSRADENILDFENRLIELRNQLDDVEGFVERHLEL